MSNVFSSSEELKSISNILTGYLKLPFSRDSIPGALMENVLGSVRNGSVLNTYDFVDVVNESKKVGWQVKSTKASTPVTWKRAKIPNAESLIRASKGNAQGLQKLGDSIISFCNDHAKESMDIYKLKELGFARLIVRPNGGITYYEKLLCDVNHPKIFLENEFQWKWSIPKIAKKKEQFPALHGTHKPTGNKWFAWHGLGENQLHFSGEKFWWPDSDESKIDFNFPNGRLSQNQLMKLLVNISGID